MLLLSALGHVGCGGADAPAPSDLGADTSSACVPVGTQELSCAGGVDEDCDGYVDCLDVDCASAAACVATCVPSTEGTPATCGNGLDDDCDGLTDCADSGCIQPGLFTCLGVPWSSRCVGALPGSQTMITTGVELLLTSSGVSGTAAHSTSGVTVDIVTVGAGVSPDPVDLIAPPNDDRDSCTHCFVLHRGGKDFYVRRANVVLGALPTEVGQPFSATLTGSFEEVSMVGTAVTPVAGGECLVLTWTLTGSAVSTTASLGLAGTGAAVTAGLQGRMGQGAALDKCNGDDTLTNNTFDCACGQARQIACPGGHSCPEGSVCLTQGRCACEADRLPLVCATGGVCGTGGTTCDPGSAWSCVRVGCGRQNYTVNCGNGYSCPTNSTCAGTYCACDPGYLWAGCAIEEGLDYGWCVRDSIVACGSGYDPTTTGCSTGGEGGNYCGAHSTCGPNSTCVCDPGYVAATCDGVRCSDENLCQFGGPSNGCFPDAQVL